MRNCNNEFILIIYIAQRKMADFERRELVIGIDFGCSSLAKRNNFSEDSSEPKKYAQVIRVQGWQSHEVFNSNYLFCRHDVSDMYFSYLDFKRNTKLLLQPIGKYYLVATILTNCHTCLYGSLTSTFFRVDPPSLEMYLSNM